MDAGKNRSDVVIFISATIYYELDNKFDEGDSLDEVQHKDSQKQHRRGAGTWSQS